MTNDERMTKHQQQRATPPGAGVPRLFGFRHSRFLRPWSFGIRHSGRSLSCDKRLRVHLSAFLDLLNSLNHHAFFRLETLLNDPHRAGALANFNGPDVGLVVAADHHDLVAATRPTSGPLKLASRS